MRIGVIGLLQESNTFLNAETHLRRFRDDVLATGDEIRSLFHGAHHEIGGFLAELDCQDINVAPIFVARALPYGTMTDETYSQLCNILDRQLDSLGEVDGVLVACHGANVARSTPDVDGDWLSRIRRRVGEGVPVIGTLDPHANLSPLMVAQTNALLAYRTNPHVDQFDCGVQATKLLMRTVRGEVNPTQAACFPPMAMSIDKQATSESPCREHFEHADEMIANGQVLSNSILLGFPYADVPEMGSSAIAVTDGNQQDAQQRANEMGLRLWDDRKRFVCDSVAIDAAIDAVIAAENSAPICLLDMGDNVGGGSPADGTMIAQRLLSKRVARSLVCLFDPQVVQQAKRVGIGGVDEFAVGGKTDDQHGPPLVCSCRVDGIFSGRFSESEPMHGGFTEFDQGETAVLSTNCGLTLVVTSERMVPFSLGQLTSCQIQPEKFQLLVAKGVNAPIAAYQKVCRKFIRVDTPGVTAANMTQLKFGSRRSPLFPFEDFEWTA